MRRTRYDPDGLRLPIKLDSTSNGEFAPVPLQPLHRHARRLGQTRRVFLFSTCGAATTLLAMNAAFLAGGKRGASYSAILLLIVLTAAPPFRRREVAKSVG